MAAREKHEERGEVVDDEGEVPSAGEEDGEVEEVGGEVGDAEVQHEALEFRVFGGEASVCGGEDCSGGEERRRSAVEDGNETAGGFGSDLGAPLAEDDEVAEEVNEEE
ncbi:hypothetical protein GmHk_19G054553 [Glycine max]|nr:hypothetical protein GmHk_19G054553 [Glycine max]